MHIIMTANAAWNIWNFRRSLVQAMITDNHKVTVLAPRDHAAPKLENIGCHFCAIEISVRGRNPLKDFKFQKVMEHILRKEKPDVIFSYTIKNNIFGAIAAKSLDIPFLPNVTGLGTAFLSGNLLKKISESLYRRSFANLPIIFFQNDDDKKLFVKRGIVSEDQALLLPGSGIDLQHFAVKPMPHFKRPTTFLMIARLLRDKGVMEFLEAAQKLRSRNSQVRFQLLGPIGSEDRGAIGRSTIEAYVANGGLEYLGSSEDVRPYIAAASCVVLPSYREGAPRSLMEAAAMGRPVITSDVPGCRAVVDANVSGFLCEPRSSESLADAMQRFLSLPNRARLAMGIAGRAKMEDEFDQSLVIEAYRKALTIVCR